MNLLLTEKQIRVLRFFRDYRREHGISPTLEEAAAELGVSKITIFEHVKNLEEKGAVRRDPMKARSVAILYDPDSETHQPAEHIPELPICGTIAAGRPIDVIETIERVALTELVPTGDDYYVLRVQGKSMIDDHIDDGDFVVIKRQRQANNGDIVVAVVDDEEEATLKRYYRDGTRVRLQPANAALDPIYPDHVEIRGVLKGVIRRLR